MSDQDCNRFEVRYNVKLRRVSTNSETEHGNLIHEEKVQPGLVILRVDCEFNTFNWYYNGKSHIEGRLKKGLITDMKSIRVMVQVTQKGDIVEFV